MSRTASPRARAVGLRIAGLLVLAAVGATALAAADAAPDPDAPGGDRECAEEQVDGSVAELTECVTLDGVLEHLAAFQEIADDNDGTRASGTPGYAASADYVQERLAQAGWRTARNGFEFPFFQLRGSSFARVAPAAAEFAADTDYAPMTHTGSGTVDDGATTPVALDSAASGCAAGDFAGFPAGTVALVRRGTCAFGVKAAHAEAAGAAALVVVNTEEEPLAGTLGAPGVAIPVLGVPAGRGRELAVPGTTVDLAVDAASEVRRTENVVAELPGAAADTVVMAGAHLDSVLAGPGIDDNGSGSAALLEVAENLSGTELPNSVRFAWWGAEELGLLGSQHYVRGLAPPERNRIALYLNLDMVGSPNPARFVYDGDQSAFPAPDGVPVPAGSDRLEYVFEDFYEQRGVCYEGTQFSGRSDYQAFVEAGIPSGGLFTGAEGIKQPYQADAYGGEAGVAFDPNYHRAGDDLGNVDRAVLDLNADALAYAVLTLAHGGEPVTAAAGTPVPGGTFQGDPAARTCRLAPPADPAGPAAGGHDHGGAAA